MNGLGAEVRVGTKIRHTRLLNAVTLKQVAEAAGCSESVLSKIENGRANAISDKADAPVASTKRLGENQSGRLDGRRVTFAMSVDSRRAEEMLRRLADDGVEIVDHV